MAGAAALAVCCALLCAPTARAAAAPSSLMRRQFVLQADAELVEAASVEEWQPAARSQLPGGPRRAAALVDAAGAARLAPSGEAPAAAAHAAAGGSGPPAHDEEPGDAAPAAAALLAGAPPMFFQVNATKAAVHGRTATNATHRGRRRPHAHARHRAPGAAAPASQGAAPARAAAYGHGAASASGARAGLVRREPRREASSLAGQGERNGTDSGSRPRGLLSGFAEVLLPGDEGGTVGESGIALLVFMVFACLRFGTRLGSVFSQHSLQADANPPRAAGQAAAAATRQPEPRRAEDALLAVDTPASAEEEPSRAASPKAAAPTSQAASAWRCIAAHQPRAATEALDLCSVPAVERLLPAAGGYDCTLSRPLSSRGPVRLQARVEGPSSGLPALAAPLSQRPCVLFSAAASRRVHGGLHGGLTVAFEARCLDFVVVLADAPYASIDVVGAEVSLFDMQGGRAASAWALEASPAHYQDFADRCRVGPAGWQRTGAAPTQDEGAALEFEECALVVGAHVTLVGELLRDASGRLLLQPPQVAGEEPWRTSWERAGASGSAPEAGGPLLGKVLVSDDPALLRSAPAEA